MLFNDTESALPAAVTTLSPRAGSSSQTTDASRVSSPNTRVVRQIAALIIEALERLGSAMSGGGRYPPVGLM
jgi:hypothetical protein